MCREVVVDEDFEVDASAGVGAIWGGGGKEGEERDGEECEVRGGKDPLRRGFKG